MHGKIAASCESARGVRVRGLGSAESWSFVSLRGSKDCCRHLYQWESRVKVYEEQSGDQVGEHQVGSRRSTFDVEFARHLNLQSGRLTTCKLARKEAINYICAKQALRIPWIFLRSAKARVARNEGKGDKTVKPKACFYCWKPGNNKSECRNFSAALRQKAVQPDKAGRHVGVEVDPESGKRKSSG